MGIVRLGVGGDEANDFMFMLVTFIKFIGIGNRKFGFLGVIGGIFAGLAPTGDMAFGVSLSKIRRSIYQIRVISEEANFAEPWLHGHQRSGSGTGFYIGDHRILTNAHVVANARFITVQRDGDHKPTIAHIKYIAHDSDLAILEPEDRSAFERAIPLRFGGLPELQRPVATIGYPMGGEQISITEGVVSRISYRKYAHSGYHKHLLVQVDSAINPGNSGGPVLQGDYVVGVAFQAYNEAENTGYIIPPPVVERFLRDIKDGTYDGHPDIGLSFVKNAVANPAMRAFHGLGPKDGGVVISQVARHSALFKEVSVSDVVLEIDGHGIGEDGKIDFAGERVSFEALYDLKQIGDRVKLKLKRGNEIKEIQPVIEKNPPHYQLSSDYVRFPRFDIYAGLVFTPLSRNYLKVWGSKWYKDAPPRLRYLHWYSQSEERFADVEDIVVLSGRLPHPINAEAEGFEESVVDAINGVRIKSLRDVRPALEKGTGEFIEIELWQSKHPIVLPRKDAATHHEDILERYGIFPKRWFGEPKEDGVAK